MLTFAPCKKEEMKIEVLFKLYYRPLCLYAMHYLNGDIDEAEDIVQDCFAKSWEHQPDNPKAYLYTAVYHACIDVMRKYNPISEGIEPQDLEGDITDEQAQERSLREAKLWSAIDDLPEKCRTIFLMNKRDGMKYKEIAEELGLSEKTVEHQISNALRKLRGNRAEILYVLSLYV